MTARVRLQALAGESCQINLVSAVLVSSARCCELRVAIKSGRLEIGQISRTTEMGGGFKCHKPASVSRCAAEASGGASGEQ